MKWKLFTCLLRLFLKNEILGGCYNDVEEKTDLDYIDHVVVSDLFAFLSQCNGRTSGKEAFIFSLHPI